jgi:hypothetical protein
LFRYLRLWRYGLGNRPSIRLRFTLAAIKARGLAGAYRLAIMAGVPLTVPKARKA